MMSYLQKANRAVHHMVVTPSDQHPVADKMLLQAMKQVYGPDGEPKRHSVHGYLINTPMEEDELHQLPVLKWITPGAILQGLTFEAKSLINKIKEFLNSNQVAVWLHDTDEPDHKCHSRKGPHLHIVSESTCANSRNLKNFRALQNACTKFNCGLYVSKVMSTPDKVYLYQLQDPEKTFLGSNSRFCLDTINELRNSVDAQVDGFDENIESDNQTNVLSKVNPALLKGPVSTEDAEPGDKRAGPSDLPPRKRSKHVDNVYLLQRCIEQNPDVGSLQEMVLLYKNTEDYQQLADMFFDVKADKYWTMAQQECSTLSQEADIYHRLDEVPDSLRNMMTPEQTLALFNSWCEEQAINARALAYVLIACLQGRVYKKIGVYLQGASNSGKTYWTSTLFHPMSKIVGKMTTGGRFCLQDCSKKRIIIGEEVGIAVDNVDRLKELMSGEVTTFERKMKSPGTCKANLVLLNSNNLPFANVPQEKAALENRMFLFRNLKKSKVLPSALRGMNQTRPNPKFLRLIEPPTAQELQDLNAGVYPRTTYVTDNLGLVPQFNGDWESWSEELARNRQILESDMAAPEFIIDGPTLASQPIVVSPELVSPDCPEGLKSIRIETEWPFAAQPQMEEDLNSELQYFFPTLTEVDVIPPTPENKQSDESKQHMEFVQEAYCDFSPSAFVSQDLPFDGTEDDHPWKRYDQKWPGASNWVAHHGPPSAYHKLNWSSGKGFHWIESLAEMSTRNFQAAQFMLDNPKPTKRAKLVCRHNNKWQWLCPAQDESFFKCPAPKDCPVRYLDIVCKDYEENVANVPIDAWSTEDFYLDGAGYFIHKDCDKNRGTDIVYVMLKNGKWDIVTKTRIPQINRNGKCVRKLIIDAAPMLDFFPSDEVPEACCPKMLPVWLPRSFINTAERWSEDDMDSIQDLFYLIAGYKQPFKGKVLKIDVGPMHTWPDVSDYYPDRVAELEDEAQACADGRGRTVGDDCLEVDHPW